MNWEELNERAMQLMLEIGAAARVIGARLQSASNDLERLEILYNFNQLVYEQNELLQEVVEAYLEAYEHNLPIPPQLLGVETTYFSHTAKFVKDAIATVDEHGYGNLIPYTLVEDYERLTDNIHRLDECIRSLIVLGRLEAVPHFNDALFNDIARNPNDSAAGHAYEVLSFKARFATRRGFENYQVYFHQKCIEVLNELLNNPHLVDDYTDDPCHKYRLRATYTGWILRAAGAAHNQINAILYQLQGLINNHQCAQQVLNRFAAAAAGVNDP